MTPAANGNGHRPAVLTVGLWRGYVKAEFVATVSEGETSFVAGRSPAFSWRGRGEPDENDPGALAAYEALLEALAGGGWEPVERLGPWYAYSFRRVSGEPREQQDVLPVRSLVEDSAAAETPENDR